MNNTQFANLKEEASIYWAWHLNHPAPAMNSLVAKEGAGSELRSQLFHFGTVLPVYLSVVQFLRTLPDTKGLTLLELGSGSGRLLAYIKSQFPSMDIWGTDYSNECIKYAKQAYGQYNIHFIHDSAQKTTVKANSMNFVISSHVIEHVSKKDGVAFINESKRLLKNKGIAFIGTPERRKSQDIYLNNPQDIPKFRLVPPHEHEYTYDELKKLGEQIYGIKNVRVEKLFNPIFYKIFSSSIAKFKPGKNILQNIKNYGYITVRDKFPKHIFDIVTQVGAKIQMKMFNLSYFDVLMANRIESQKSSKISDNILLIAKK